MSKRLFLSILAVSAAVISLSASRVDGLDNSAPSGTAVVSIPEVIDSSEYANQLDSGLQKEKENALSELEQYKAEIDSLRADMKTRKPDSEEYEDLKQKVMEKTAVAEARKKHLQESLVKENREIMEQLYLEIVAVSKEVCKEKNIEILIDRDQLKLPSRDSQELSGIIKTHKVIYYAPHIDITDEIIERLDQRSK
ncbi:OmpH family outer membrane protein [Sedimentisphaera salicampi]|uniref:Outer membrane protein n=1 Tax=Sedimentisphaera salicampi TaxID=1941349 RepID=A0A1W6LIV9_9BACT|nr:OmpH family outer membrane protein [Sedimentisphaera salicampi]ARN55673.1 Outer membrane protein [Sedimentisphaera salicampi]OXU16192.1 Outer membrane protein [Sedimentisphaera salicampi]